MEIIKHPQSGRFIKGVQLPIGAVLKELDMCASPDGEWKMCTTPGVRIGNPQAIWVRPNELSPEAKGLLISIVEKDETTYVCWVPRVSRWVLTRDEKGPDAKDTCDSFPVIEHSERLPELTDLGYLELHLNGTVLHLTEMGQKAGEKLAAVLV